MNIAVVGTNHKFSPLEFRERIAFPGRSRERALLLLKESHFIKGAVMLSTCNRVELYASLNDPAGKEELENFLSRYHELERERLVPYLYRYEGQEAIRHLFSVACGLDSMILGETQILGQLRSAFSKAQSAGCIDRDLECAFDAAITFSKRMRRETEICAGKVSIGSLTIDFIKEKAGGLTKKNVLIIGAGKVTELVLTYLKDDNPRVVFISNRTFEKAREMARAIDQQAARLDKLPQLLKQADVLITATASPHFVIKKETLEGISRKLLIVDLAVPRDVDPQVRRLSNVDLFNLEDLYFIAQKNLEKRQQEAKKISVLIDREAAVLWQRLFAREAEPVFSR